MFNRMGMAIMAIDTMAIAPTTPMSVILQATLLNPAMALLLPATALLLPVMTLLLPVMALLLLAMTLLLPVMTLLLLVMTLLLLVMTHPLLVRFSTDKYYRISKVLRIVLEIISKFSQLILFLTTGDLADNPSCQAKGQ